VSPTVSNLPAAQKRAIAQDIQGTEQVKREPTVKEEAGIRAAATSSSRTSAPKPASKSKESQKPEDKKPARKDSHKKPSRHHGAPSNPDSDPDSSEDDWDDDDSDSSGDDVPMHVSNQATLQDGTTAPSEATSLSWMALLSRAAFLVILASRFTLSRSLASSGGKP
jgi:hypothetical protein